MTERRPLPVWQTSAYYAVLFTLFSFILGFVTRPIFWFLSLPVVKYIPFAGLIVELATVWLSAYLAIRVLRQFLTIELSRKFTIWALVVYLPLNIGLLLIDHSLISGLMGTDLGKMGTPILVIVGTMLLIIMGALFWWVTILVSKGQPDWAVRWVEWAISWVSDKLAGLSRSQPTH